MAFLLSFVCNYLVDFAACIFLTSIEVVCYFGVLMQFPPPFCHRIEANGLRKL